MLNCFFPELDRTRRGNRFSSSPTRQVDQPGFLFILQLTIDKRKKVQNKDFLVNDQVKIVKKSKNKSNTLLTAAGK